MAEHLRFSPDILARLGEELVPDIDQGLLELVKNAYDADAESCTVALRDADEGVGSIEVRDTGSGMTAEALRGGWLVIGRSGKKHKEATPRYGRIPAGDKGLGRLAALRLGRKVTLRTRSIKEPGIQHELILNWDDFDAAEVIEDVEIRVTSVNTDLGHGTDILIEELKNPVNRTAANKLARNLLLLADPFAKESGGTPVQRATEVEGEGAAPDPGFKPELVSDEYSDLQAKVNRAYFDDAEYRINASVDEFGQASFKIIDWKGDVLHQESFEGTFDAPPFAFDLWVFILDSGRFSNKKATVNEVRDWLKVVGGVHIYEDGMRVPPYGGPDDDWLGINLRRVRSPELRPSTNTSLGRIRLSNVDRRLAQKTDRIGYIENHSFSEIRRCCQEALDWAAKVQTKERDRRRQAEKKSAKQKTERASSRLEAVLTKVVAPVERKQVEDAIQQYVKEVGHDTKSLREDLQLYRSLATAGMTSAIFSHEVGRPLKLIDGAIKSLRKLIPVDRQAQADKRINQAAEAKLRVNSFVSIPLTLLAKRKRRFERITVSKTIANLVDLVQPIMKYYKISLILELTSEYTDINGSEALLDGICMNFLMNSVEAFQRVKFAQLERKIRIRTSYDGSSVILAVADNAGGIDGIDLDEIWLPGVTTDPEGTGFGLTIVRDSVVDLSGSVSADTKCDFGGAQFFVSLPPMRNLFG